MEQLPRPQGLEQATKVPYSLLKYQEVLERTAAKYFQILDQKHFQRRLPSIDLRQRQTLDLITLQFQEYALKSSKREISQLMQKFNMADKLNNADYLNIRHLIRSKINQESWEDFDKEEQFLDQLHSFLVQKDQELGERLEKQKQELAQRFCQ